MKIIEYDKRFRKDFIELNKAWIIDNFEFLEKEDIETFDKIDEHITNGAMIYFVIKNDIVLATCMALPIENNTWEICKLASNKNYEHKGAGSAVFETAMKYAIENGAKRPNLRTVNNHIIGNSYFNKKIILKNIKNHLFLV